MNFLLSKKRGYKPMEMKRLTLSERMNLSMLRKTKMINSSHKLPIVLLLDTSGSMNYNDNISKLNQGVQKFYECLLQESEAPIYTEICVITFGHEGIQIQVEFGDPRQQIIPNLKASGSSPLCSAMLMGLDLLEDQIDIYNERGLQSHPPVFITLTDGEPTTLEYKNNVPVLLTKEMEEYTITKQRFDYFINKMNLDAYTIFFGEGVENTYFLEQFASKDKNIKKLDELDIIEFFKELGRSTSLLSKLAPTGASQLVMDDFDIFKNLTKKTNN